jgi:hypothetical protein
MSFRMHSFLVSNFITQTWKLFETAKQMKATISLTTFLQRIYIPMQEIDASSLFSNA